VELRRPEEAVPEGGEPRPSNSWLDSFLERREVHGLEMLQSLTEGDQLPRLVCAGLAPCLCPDVVHSFPFFLGSEHLRTHNCKSEKRRPSETQGRPDGIAAAAQALSVHPGSRCPQIPSPQGCQSERSNRQI